MFCTDLILLIRKFELDKYIFGIYYISERADELVQCDLSGSMSGRLVYYLRVR